MSTLTASSISTSNENDQFIEIDGSYLEGGGQILRITTALSVLLKKSIKISKIRAGRKDGGLKAQHLTGITLLAEISKAKLFDAKIGSTEVKFIPSELKHGKFLADIKTAGSICLLIQNSLPCLLFAKEESILYLKGGTNAANAPQIEYFQLVFTPIAKNFGIETECQILKRGYFPKGMGEVYLKIKPVDQLKPVDITSFGALKHIKIRSFCSKLPINIANTMNSTAHTKLMQLYSHITIEKEVFDVPNHESVGPGTGIIIIAETTTGCLLASSGLGKKGISAEEIANEAVNSLIMDINNENCVDEFMQDQLILFMGLANGKSRIKSGPLTLHTKTAIFYTELLTGVKFNIIPINNNFIIECDGMGLSKTH